MLKDTSSLKAKLALVLVPLFTLTLFGCGGGGSSETNPLNEGETRAVEDVFNYTGVWDTRYNLIKDECRLVFDILVGVTDQIIVVQEGATAMTSGLGSFLRVDDAFVDADDILTIKNVVDGDVFGNGDNCNFDATSTLDATNDLDNDDNSANALLHVTVSCASGFQCESQGIGSSERQMRPDSTVLLPDESAFDIE